MAQATQTIEINASPKECFAVITDYENYPKFLSDSKEVVVVKRSGKTAEVKFTIEIIKKISYTLKMVENPPKGVTWSLMTGEMMKSNNGLWVLEDAGNGKTRATYSVEVGLGLLVPGAVSKILIGSNLPSMMAAFKKRIEEKKRGS